jgi:hypothetical protein
MSWMANEETARGKAHRDRAKFRQADVERALKGALAAGLAVGRIEVDQNGKIIIIADGTAAKHQEAIDARGGIIGRRIGSLRHGQD